jgi:cytochrome c peroxidase
MLWEVAKTGPYMHNGIFETLDQVIEFFDRGGGKGNTALKPLKLSPAEKKQLTAFLVEALSGEDAPFTFPKVP